MLVRCRRLGSPRRAYASLLLIISLPVLALAFGLAINYSYIHDARTHLRRASDAAAFAAAYELVDDRVLADPADPTDLLALLKEAHQEAQNYIDRNPTPLGPGEVTLDPNPKNDKEGDVVFGFLKHRKDKDLVLADLERPDARLARINTVQVKAERCRKRGNQISLLPVPFQMTTSADVCSVSTAYLDGYIQGFRPSKSVTIPMAPLGILTGSGPMAWESLLRDREDAWSYDRGLKLLTPGADRIYEVEVRLLQRMAMGEKYNACLLQFGAAGLDDLAEQVVNGIGVKDVEDFGGQIVLPGDGSGLPVPGTLLGPAPDSQGGSELTVALKSLAASGESRIWPLFSVEGGGTGIVVRGFVAARVAEVKPARGNLSLHFVLQPCRLATATAVTFLPDERNPVALGWNDYICKVRLTE